VAGENDGITSGSVMIRDSDDGWEWELRDDGENEAIGFLVRRGGRERKRKVREKRFQPLEDSRWRVNGRKREKVEVVGRRRRRSEVTGDCLRVKACE
jgi:hypothetical protein